MFLKIYNIRYNKLICRYLLLNFTHLQVPNRWCIWIVGKWLLNRDLAEPFICRIGRKSEVGICYMEESISKIGEHNRCIRKSKRRGQSGRRLESHYSRWQEAEVRLDMLKPIRDIWVCFTPRMNLWGADRVFQGKQRTENRCDPLLNYFWSDVHDRLSMMLSALAKQAGGKRALFRNLTWLRREGSSLLIWWMYWQNLREGELRTLKLYSILATYAFPENVGSFYIWYSGV